MMGGNIWLRNQLGPATRPMIRPWSEHQRVIHDPERLRSSM